MPMSLRVLVRSARTSIGLIALLVQDCLQSTGQLLGKAYLALNIRPAIIFVF